MRCSALLLWLPLAHGFGFAAPSRFRRHARHRSASTDEFTTLFIECGFGNDSHGQNATKAAVRACRNAIEFNSIPSIGQLVPNGYDGMQLRVQIAVPATPEPVDIAAIERVFPYGAVSIEVEEGGMRARSGIVIPAMGDTNDDMIIAIACVTVGYTAHASDK